MKKLNYFLFAVSLAIVISAIALWFALYNDTPSERMPAPKQQSTQEQASERQRPFTIPQLSEERADAATMVLISAPPLQPADHIGRWNPKTQGDSCLICHEQGEEMGARDIPVDHFVDEDRSKGIFGPRYVCVTCHSLDLGDPRPAFNRDQ